MSKDHINAMSILCMRRSTSKHCIDYTLTEQYQKQVEYWIEVLERVVSVVKFIAIRGLAFRGKSKLIGLSNNGIFWGIVGTH